MPVQLAAPSTQNSELVDGSTSHSALARCREVFEQTLAAGPPGSKGEYFARKNAPKAYKSALPPLIGVANIRDFIACVAQGVLLEAIDEKQSARLIHAARAALMALHTSPPAEKPVS